MQILTRTSTLKKANVLSLLSIGLLSVLALLSGCKKEISLAPPDVPTVEVATPFKKTVAIYGEYVGQMDSPETVEFRARVEGFLKEICFHEGDEVEKGSLMFVIDPSQYEIAVQTSEAQLRVANAQVQTATANLHQAQNSLDRVVMQANVEKIKAELFNAQQDLSEKREASLANAVARSMVESAEAREKQAQAALEASKAAYAQSEQDYKTHLEAAVASVAQANASVATATAQLDQAKLNLLWTKIYSPVKGRVGLCNVKIGMLLGHSNDLTVLATVSRVDPIDVYFTVSERAALQIEKTVRENKLGHLGNGNLPIRMILDNGKMYDETGKIDFVDRTVDSATGTLKMRAEFPNPDRFLRPGNYAKVRMMLKEQRDALLIDEAALRRDLGGAYVMVVDETNTAQHRPVKTGPNENGMIVIEEGLKDSDRVVVKGVQRARSGGKVNPEQVPARVADNSKAADATSGITK